MRGLFALWLAYIGMRDFYRPAPDCCSIPTRNGRSPWTVDLAIARFAEPTSIHSPCEANPDWISSNGCEGRVRQDLLVVQEDADRWLLADGCARGNCA